MVSPIYKHWREWLDEDGFVKKEVQEQKLAILERINCKLDELLPVRRNLDSAVNYILEPNITIIKEYNTTFWELMSNHSHKYNTKRIVPIQIIRSLIDVGAAFKVYIDSPDKTNYLIKYHQGYKFDKIDGKNITHYVDSLNQSYSFVLELYRYCCNYVHTNYLQAKSNSTWDCSTKPGKIGFMNAYYKVKYEDFSNELIDGTLNHSDIPFDYEEEVDIIDYCIKVNDMLIELVKEVIQ